MRYIVILYFDNITDHRVFPNIYLPFCTDLLLALLIIMEGFITGIMQVS